MISWNLKEKPRKKKKKRNKTKPHRKRDQICGYTERERGGRGGAVGRSGVGIGEKRSKDTNFQLINKY